MSEFEDKLNSILNDPGQMGKIAEMAKSLMGGENKKAEPEKENFNVPDMGIDMDTVSKITKIISRLKDEGDDKTALLQAMEPYLNEKRREKLQKGIKLAKLSKIAKLALGEAGGGGSV